MQGLLEAPQISVQTKLSGSAAWDEDICERSTVGLVAGGKIKGNLIRLAGALLGVSLGFWPMTTSLAAARYASPSSFTSGLSCKIALNSELLTTMCPL
jgi:hypothetical protein